MQTMFTHAMTFCALAVSTAYCQTIPQDTELRSLVGAHSQTSVTTHRGLAETDSDNKSSKTSSTPPVSTCNGLSSETAKKYNTMMGHYEQAVPMKKGDYTKTIVFDAADSWIIKEISGDSTGLQVGDWILAIGNHSPVFKCKWPFYSSDKANPPQVPRTKDTTDRFFNSLKSGDVELAVYRPRGKIQQFFYRFNVRCAIYHKDVQITPRMQDYKIEFKAADSWVIGKISDPKTGLQVSDAILNELDLEVDELIEGIGSWSTIYGCNWPLSPEQHTKVDEGTLTRTPRTPARTKKFFDSLKSGAACCDNPVEVTFWTPKWLWRGQCSSCRATKVKFCGTLTVGRRRGKLQYIMKTVQDYSLGSILFLLASPFLCALVLLVGIRKCVSCVTSKLTCNPN